MNCADVEIVLCDYLDGTLAPERRAELESHISGCANCAELARDAGAGLAMLEREPEIHPPQELVTRILHQIPQSRPFGAVDGVLGWMNRMLEPIRQPRYVMGAMCTILSLAMMTRCAGVPVRTLRAEDLNPERVWVSLETRVERMYDRTMKTYESMRLVYEVRQELRQWREQQQEQEAAAPVESREIPAKKGTAADAAGRN
jgi:hypothetical protein